MERLVLLSQPVWLTLEKKNSRRDLRKITEIYGFKTIFDPDKERLCSRINDYVTYICAASKWMQEGNSIDDNIFISNHTGKRYEETDPFIQDYMAEALKERKLEWVLIDTNKSLDGSTPGMIECGEYVGSRKLWEKLLEYGAIVYSSQNNLNK